MKYKLIITSILCFSFLSCASAMAYDTSGSDLYSRSMMPPVVMDADHNSQPKQACVKDKELIKQEFIRETIRHNKVIGGLVDQIKKENQQHKKNLNKLMSIREG